ncbi:MAG: pilus assembly protein [Planctomycetota bacterium]|nr:pilus assembly protein [Planctomycetota bacterium]
MKRDADRSMYGCTEDEVFMTRPLGSVRTALGRWPHLGSIATACRQFARCNKGIASVELALILWLFILFVFGNIGFALVSYAHNNMVNAAREATRRLSVADGVDCTVGGATGTCTGAPMVCGVDPITAGTAEDIACGYLANWGLEWTVTADEVVVDACDSTVQVMIVTSAEDAFVVDFLGFFGAGDLLTVEVKMRKELEKRCTL